MRATTTITFGCRRRMVRGTVKCIAVKNTRNASRPPGLPHAPSSRESEMRNTAEDIMVCVDEATDPILMSKSEALDVLKEVRAAVDGRIEALRNELADGAAHD